MITKKLFKIVVQSQLRTGLMDSANGMLFERFEDAELYVDRLLKHQNANLFAPSSLTKERV